jgi:hypothetical protein
MIIDCHTHVMFKPSGLPSLELEILLEAMERVGIDKACLAPWSKFESGHFFHNEEDTIKVAEIIEEVISDYPDKFFMYLWLNPALPPDFNIKVVEKYIVNGKIDGVKFHIQMNARDKRMESLLEILQAYDIPVLFHAWYKTVSTNTYESNPSDVADLARRFPNLNRLCLTLCLSIGFLLVFL